LRPSNQDRDAEEHRQTSRRKEDLEEMDFDIVRLMAREPGALAREAAMEANGCCRWRHPKKDGS
jgi:hypothetical protein